ncbi:MAG: methionine synthase [Bacteroidales bacterium]|nr:methionine synthase [Bacteroidales bacterium]
MDNRLHTILKNRILLLDGGLGTMVQALELTESDYRGREFIGWKCPLSGCVDILCLSAPRKVAAIHRSYLEAGADIITTNSFSANAISLREYGLEDHVYRIARAAASIARAEADAFSTPDKPRFVAGSMGPTSKTASIAAHVGDSAAREVTFKELAETYHEQARGLIDGGADALLIETVFDTLNAKAAIYAIKQLERETSREIPVMISVTVSQKAGRTLSGQTIEAFWTSVRHAQPISVGINCSFGAREMLPHLERLASVADTFISVHPNAGLPNISGGYDETPESFAAAMKPYVERSLVNIMGGCCGTTPDFIRALAPLAASFAPRPLPSPDTVTAVSGLEQLRIVPEANFINIGERCNVAGSAKFARLIREGNYADAIEVARAQVAAGAQIIDVCMDDGLIDGPAAMRTFMNMAAGEMDIARLPFMIDSSSLETLVAGLECCQGKAIVNSISLKEGPEEFLRRASLIRSYGAAAVVMLFDEQGQATSYDRKVAVAARAYKLLTDSGFNPQDIIFDPNILSVATGIPEHDRYALDFIEAVRWIKANLPGAKVSGGVSNLSFAFRGNNVVREAMHAAFLYHARRARMDMGIVNAQMLKVYSDIEPELLERIEDVLLCRRPDASERLVEFAASLKAAADKASGTTGEESKDKADDWRNGTASERINYAMLHGNSEFIADDALEAYRLMGSPIEVINKIMMPAMERVGILFGDGKMFLPQVVKTATVMKKGVAALEPYISAGGQDIAAQTKVIVATVKGDIHDIGKNIVSVVMACNGCEIIDLGVMVEPAAIIEAVRQHKADFVCLSGLITPSLAEMINVCRQLRQAGITIPVIVGGATTSPMHTAVKIAPEYDGLVIHSTDASRNTQIINSLQSPTARVFAAGILAEQRRLRELYASAQDRRPLESYAQRLGEALAARGTNILENEPITDTRLCKNAQATCGRTLIDSQVNATEEIKVFHHYDFDSVERHIDWEMFCAEWGIRKADDKQQLIAEAKEMLQRLKNEDVLDLQGVIGTFPVRVEGDDIVVLPGECALPMLRNQTQGEENLSVADFAAEAGSVTLFAITAGAGLASFTQQLRDKGDEYGAFMAKVLADRLAEALASEVVPAREGERHAFGYPSCPDHSLKKDAFEVLKVEENCDMRLTSSYMIDPAESICGMVIPGARYFAVGHIGQDQLEDYSRRCNMPEETIKTLIPRNIR